MRVLRSAVLHPQVEIYKKIIRLDMKYGPWIAGGAVLRWFQGKPTTTDIDVFVRNEEQMIYVVKQLRKDSYSINFESSNAITLSNGGEPKIQVIIKEFFNTPQDVLDSFDITVCQFLTDGVDLLCTETAVRHLEEKILHINKVHQYSFFRLLKYQFYGFTPDQYSIDIIEKNKDSIMFRNSDNHDPLVDGY